MDVVVRRGCALVVSAVAAYASYRHQRDFALHGGADPMSAALWPLSVDGLLLLATVGLLKPSHRSSRRARYAVWSAFLLGIAVSLAANIAAAPSPAWKPIVVAGWPPIALLLSVELLSHRPDSEVADDRSHTDEAGVGGDRVPPGTDACADQGQDPLLLRAHQEDARHREKHQRPISAETLRKELRIGAARSRYLVALVRASSRDHSAKPHEQRDGGTADE
ncbi:DUF2637 domain-containing protein [Streptomyces sp. KR80]|uniref:DUF2637 domain-containing protein n=1 Tax=Streptomyces sp. KR80 TaxID=3457426 RepID=UPI003FD275CD